jgi:hypothetical protein
MRTHIALHVFTLVEALLHHQYTEPGFSVTELSAFGDSYYKQFFLVIKHYDFVLKRMHLNLGDLSNINKLVRFYITHII